MKSSVIARARRPIVPGCAMLVALVLTAVPPAAAQESQEGGPVSPDSADAIRASLQRPPASHPPDERDVVG
ncbi:MAG: hypothetical protein V3W35_06270, partial [Gemmatimonadota bacterium]